MNKIEYKFSFKLTLILISLKYSNIKYQFINKDTIPTLQ